jgi:hypothetical protein
MIITQEVYEERLDTCRKCEFLKIGFVCGKCFCPIKNKIKNASVDYCEAGKWKR